MKIYMLMIAFCLLHAVAVQAGEADVVEVKIKASGDRIYRFDVTVLHGDEGWDHYVDKWDIVGHGDILLGTRILHHPHVREQPFTRSLSGVKIDQTSNKVTVRAHDSVHGYGGKVVTVNIPE